MNKKIDLPEKYLKQIKTIIQRHLPEVEVWVYGSRLNGRSHEGSDLDLVLRSPNLKPIDNEKMDELWQALQESTIPILVEARDWAILPKSFHVEILNNYAVLN